MTRRGLGPVIALICSVMVWTAAMADGAGETAAGAPFYPQMSLEAMTAMRERPLFAPSRRPPAPPPPAPPLPEPAVRLVGVTIGDDAGFAIIEHQPTGEVLRMKDGALLDRWVLSVVDARTIAFEHEGRRAVYALFQR
jgi:hypothetical protein